MSRMESSSSARRPVPAPFFVLVLVVALLPLPFAGAPTWAWSGFVLAVGMVLVWWGVRVAFRQEPLETFPWRALLPVAAPFLAACAWAAVQAAPQTPAQLHHPLWSQAAAALHEDLVSSVSVDAFNTHSALARLLAYGAIFLLAVHYGRDRDHCGFAFRGVVLAGAVYAAYGLVEFFGGDRVLGLEKAAYVGWLTSTFINRNTYATFDGIALLCTTALFIRSLPQWVSERALWTAGSTIFLSSALVLQIVALFLTGSRGGIASVGVGVLVFVARLGSVRLGGVSARAAALVFAGLVVLLGFALAGGVLVDRLAVIGVDPSERLRVFELTVAIIREYPLVGTGYGSYEDIFRLQRDASVSGIYDKAHNTYLELATELGIPAATLLILAVVTAAMRCFAARRADARDRVLLAVGAGTSALVGVHSLVDFSVQIPAVAAIFSLVLGCAFARAVVGQRVSADRARRVAAVPASSTG